MRFLAQRTTLLEDATAGRDECLGQAKRQLERIDVPGLRVVEPGPVTLAGHPLRHLLARDELQGAVPPLARGLFLPFV